MTDWETILLIIFGAFVIFLMNANPFKVEEVCLHNEAYIQYMFELKKVEPTKTCEDENVKP